MAIYKCACFGNNSRGGGRVAGKDGRGEIKMKIRVKLTTARVITLSEHVYTTKNDGLAPRHTRDMATHNTLLFSAPRAQLGGRDRHAQIWAEQKVARMQARARPRCPLPALEGACRLCEHAAREHKV